MPSRELENLARYLRGRVPAVGMHAHCTLLRWVIVASLRRQTPPARSHAYPHVLPLPRLVHDGYGSAAVPTAMYSSAACTTPSDSRRVSETPRAATRMHTEARCCHRHVVLAVFMIAPFERSCGRSYTKQHSCSLYPGLRSLHTAQSVTGTHNSALCGGEMRCVV